VIGDLKQAESYEAKRATGESETAELINVASPVWGWEQKALTG
jgi:hypothetical protein